MKQETRLIKDHLAEEKNKVMVDQIEIKIKKGLEVLEIKKTNLKEI